MESRRSPLARIAHWAIDRPPEEGNNSAAPPPLPAGWRRCALIALACVACGDACAQDAGSPTQDAKTGDAKTLAPVEVIASRLDLVPFDVPAALTIAPVAHDHGQPGVNLSETLVGIPGILARDRQNFAQDEQISIRGFGSRATFGVRSIRLFVDGVPATMPDGQGQVSHFNLDGAARVEVLRGPFSALYGNAAGGVVQLWSAEGTPDPVTTLAFSGGSNDSFREAIDTRGIAGNLDYNLAASEFVSGGYREHSRVQRESDNARLGFDLGDARRLTVVVNRLDQPLAQDPLGLTQIQFDTDPRQAAAAALLFDTRKRIEQNQIGAVYEQPVGTDDRLRLMGYYGQRSIVQFQSIPVAVQADPLQSGGVVAPDTDYGGFDLRWTRRGTLAGRETEWVFGASFDAQRQRRRGYENFIGESLGVQGDLRRDEDDDVDNGAAYAQWYWRASERWSVLLGLRHDNVSFRERDFYVTAGNPDDSGKVRYGATTPVAGLDFRASDSLRLYASYGRGFETPSFNELGYRSDGQAGLAFDLLPSASRHLEAGAKWRITPALEWDTALFRADSRNELVVASSADGRTTYQNAGATRRQGYETSLSGHLGERWQISAGYTRLQADFRSGFLTCTATPCLVPTTPVPAGARLPGVPSAYGSLRLQHGADRGWREGLTLYGVGAVPVNDTDTEHAKGYGLADLDAGYTFSLGAAASLQVDARVDNLANRRYAGSVIVNDSNGRYFEPGPDRTWTIDARLAF